jgi:hypothetical protein
MRVTTPARTAIDLAREHRGLDLVRVVAEDHPFDILRRVRAALARRA